MVRARAAPGKRATRHVPSVRWPSVTGSSIFLRDSRSVRPTRDAHATNDSRASVDEELSRVLARRVAACSFPRDSSAPDATMRPNLAQ
jgi:hypothetical protein